MKSTIVFTSTLSSSLMSWLSGYAEEKNITKRAVLEQALKAYKENVMKEKLKESFKRAAEDPEIAAMTEEGLDDYLEQLS